ncbi:MAG: SRPBCC family protein [Candidatus Aquicultorales bacterium]
METPPKPVYDTFDGGSAVTFATTPVKVMDVLLDPKEFSSLLPGGRWDVPFGRGDYEQGSEKRFFHQVFGFTCFADKRLVKVDQETVKWVFDFPRLVTEYETWSVEPVEGKKTSVVTLRFEPRSDNAIARFFWRAFTGKRRAWEARRVLKALVLRLTPVTPQSSSPAPNGEST